MCKFLSRVALALEFFLAVALSRVPPGLTVVPTLGINQVTNLKQINTVPTSRYIVSGDRQGQVTVKDAVTGEVVRTFQMDSGVVVRETFLLDNGRTVAASQKDHAVFWDLATGREIGRFDQRIYGFSHDESKFFTYDSKQVFLYTYPNLTPICKSTPELYEPSGFQFSIDNRFVAIFFERGLSARDEDYLIDLNNVVSIVRTISVFNTERCQTLLRKLDIFSSSGFSLDSMYYYLKRIRGNNYGQRVEELWQLDLETQEFKKVSEQTLTSTVDN